MFLQLIHVTLLVCQHINFGIPIQRFWNLTLIHTLLLNLTICEKYKTNIISLRLSNGQLSAIMESTTCTAQTWTYLQAGKSQTGHLLYEFPKASHTCNFHEDYSEFHLLDHFHGLQNCIQWCPVVYHNSLNDTVPEELFLPTGSSTNRKENVT